MPYLEPNEIRHNEIKALLEKVGKHDFGKYLLKVSLVKIRAFDNEDILFDFPVTALIGTNGGGKSSVLGAAACAYKEIKPSLFFPKSSIGDNSMSEWRTEYEIIDKSISPKAVIKRNSNFRKAKWVRGDVLERPVLYFGIERTVPAGEKPKYKKLMRSTYHFGGNISHFEENVAGQIARILGKDVSEFGIAEIARCDDFLIGKNNGCDYSEFHFGAGESSIIRIVRAIEAAPENSLVLIEEIENGLHPVATRRMVQYLIGAAKRKSIQAIFTTHSNDAIIDLPDDAIWSCINGKLKQGSLDINSLRAISGKIEDELAIFVEDDFARCWVDSILRENLKEDYNRLKVYPVAGDSNAIRIHRNHKDDPSVDTKSICILDGDSSHQQSENDLIFKLPGTQPERTVYNEILDNITEYAALLTVALHRSPEKQGEITQAVEDISRSNNDAHLLFNQLGIKIGFVSEEIVRSAFLMLWRQRNAEECLRLTSVVADVLNGLNQ